MSSTRVDYTAMEWASAVPFYGPAAVHDGKDIAPPGRLIKIVAAALSDEHIFSLQGGRSTRAGQPAQGAGGYGLDSKGQPHSAMIGTETTALVVYAGEPDEINLMEVVDITPAG